MIPYIILALSPIAIAFFVRSRSGQQPIDKNRTAKTAFFVLFGLVLFVMIAFRSRYIGSSDSSNYYNNWARLSAMNFETFKDYLEITEMESGYLFTVWTLSKVFVNPQWIFIFSGLLTVCSVCSLIHKNSENIMLSSIMFITLGLYSFMVQGLRQAIAMCICFYAYQYAKEKKPFPFILLVLIAMLFHRTAIVFFIVYLFNYFKLNIKSILLFSVFSAAFFILSDRIVALANLLFNEDYQGAVDHGGVIATAIYIIIVFLGFIANSKKPFNNAETLDFYILLLGMLCYILRYVGVLSAERISFFFMFAQMLVLPKVLSIFKKKDAVLLSGIAILLSILLFIYRYSGSDLVPYMFCWEQP